MNQNTKLSNKDFVISYKKMHQKFDKAQTFLAKGICFFGDLSIKLIDG